jgi:hypothetical protein
MQEHYGEALQKEDNWDDAAYFTKENLWCPMNDMKTIIFALRDALHGRKINYIRSQRAQAEEV